MKKSKHPGGWKSQTSEYTLSIHRKRTTLETPPPLSGAQTTKPEHPKRILQTNVKEKERQPSISGTKDGEDMRMRKKDKQSNSKMLGIGKKTKKGSGGRPEQKKD